MDIPTLKFDKVLHIAVGTNATCKKWKNIVISWHDLLARLAKPTVTSETYRQFMSSSKDDQSHIKDVGGFVGGRLAGGKRDKQSVEYRDVITLDIDFSHENLWWDFQLMWDCAAALHTTHKSAPKKLRHRLIIPLDRHVSQEEYQAISRCIAGLLNIDLFDPSTFDVNRLMFWPSVSSDAKYEFEYQDGPFLSADECLGAYNDWHDTSEWPVASTSSAALVEAVKKQADPEDKPGLVGLFCRTYSIGEAIEKFLPDIYTSIAPDRYTYLPGSTAGGLITYEDKFAYSHHATDPAGGRLCNAFDLVRIHKFGHLDPTGGGENKSFRAMEDLIKTDPEVSAENYRERREACREEFGMPLPEEPAAPVKTEEEDEDWTKKLTLDRSGAFASSTGNIRLIIKYDPFLKGAFRLNQFDNKRYIMRALPWRKDITKPEPVKDVDYAGMRAYLELNYGIVASQKTDDALALEFEANKFHPIRDYLKSLEWDELPRVDTLAIEYFGSDDTPYTRAVMRKSLVGAVKRVMEPGEKFDTALVLVGSQGTGKSTFLKKLGGNWFSDSFMTVSGKESFEQLQGVWIMEMAELAGLKKAEIESIKHYITKQNDQFRPAYGRVVETYPRQCVFFGTTNNKDFLRDATGNRRFWPVDVHEEKAKRDVFKDLTPDEIDQIWAEAYALYKAGEDTYLKGEESQMALDEQRKHAEVDERAGVIHAYLDRALPDDWQSKDIYDRKKWLDDPLTPVGHVRRNVVCIAEVWCECLGKDKADLNRYNSREINEILRSLPDWEPVMSTKNFGPYGKQKYYKRKEN